MRVIEAVEEVNNKQKEVLFNKLNDIFKGDLKGKKIALWGLAFKPETDDMRAATALVLIDQLNKAGADVTVYDPVAMEETHRRIGDVLTFFKDMYSLVVDSDALVLVTDRKSCV